MFKFKHNGQKINSEIFFNGEKAFVRLNGDFTPLNLPTEEIEVIFMNNSYLLEDFSFSAYTGIHPNLIDVQDIFFGNPIAEQEAYVLNDDNLVLLEDLSDVYIKAGNDDFEFCSSCNGTGSYSDNEVCLDCGGDGLLF